MDETKDNAFSLLTTDNVRVDDVEDAENEEDQRRRQQELQSMLANAFDDIGYDDDNSTINSSFESAGNVRLSGNRAYVSFRSRGSGGNGDAQYREASFNSMEQLQLLYEVQVREIQKLNQQLETLKEESDKERNGLKKKLLLMESEHNGMGLSLKQCQELLIEKTRDIEGYVKDIEHLQQSLKTAENIKKQTDEDLLLWRTKSLDLEQKLNLIEKGLYVPVSEKQIRNKYEKDIGDLQTSLEQTEKSMESLRKLNACLQNEVADLKQEKEMQLMQKEEEIHAIYSELENTKYYCHNLTDKLEHMEKEHQNLTAMLNNTTQNESKEVGGTMKILEQELKRSLEDQKHKRDEIVQLEKALEERKKKEVELTGKIDELSRENQGILMNNHELKRDNEGMRDTIEELNQKINVEFEEDRKKLQMISDENSKLKRVVEDLEKRLETELKSVNMVDNDELQELRIQKEKLEEKRQKLSKDFDDVTAENDFLKIQLEQRKVYEALVKTDDETKENKLKNQCENLKKQLHETERNATTWKQQLEEYERMCLELQETCASQKGKIYEDHVRITELEGKLILKEKHSELLDDLQQKAHMFEKYLKAQSELVLCDKNVGTDESDEKNQNEEIKKLWNENKALKDKVMFDRKALSELTDVWNEEIHRLNSVIKELKREMEVKNEEHKRQEESLNGELHRLNSVIKVLEREVEVKNEVYKRQEESLNGELSRMAVVISKLGENIKAKEKIVKECQEREQRHVKEFNEKKERLKSEYKLKEKRILLEHEQDENAKEEFKRKEDEYKRKEDENKKREDELRMKMGYMQRSCSAGLLDIQTRIRENVKKVEEKAELEDRMIEMYYDMMIMRAKSQKN